MNKHIKRFLDVWKKNYIFRTLISSLASSLIGVLFIIFNGALGVIYNSLWHGTICIYYILLTMVRGTIIFFQRNEKHRNELDGSKLRTTVSKCTHMMLFILNLALIVPISIMVKGERAYTYGLIPAIAMAAYTVYRIVISSINLKKVKKESNCLVRELRVINMIDTLVAILTLQNALIISKGGMDSGMKILISYTSTL